MGILWKENGIFKEEGIERGESLWIQKQFRDNEAESNNTEKNNSENKNFRPSLKGDISTEVTIIGGGLAGSMRAKKVVIATHYPFINVPGYYFIRLHQESSYLVAMEGCGKAKDDFYGMYLDADQDGFTFRKYKDYMILGGGYHRTGQYKPLDSYKKIEKATKKWYPKAQVKYTWSNQDCMTPDSVPYIGRYSIRKCRSNGLFNYR